MLAVLLGGMIGAGIVLGRNALRSYKPKAFCKLLLPDGGRLRQVKLLKPHARFLIRLLMTLTKIVDHGGEVEILILQQQSFSRWVHQIRRFHWLIQNDH